jgi:1,4-alpha-glucan branching enzyme
MGIRKMYVKNRDVCKVTFSLPGDMASSAESACVVGDFNGWQVGATPMKKSKDGSFTATVNLSCGGEYQFRYLLDGTVWENEGNADRQVFSPYGNTENSVVVI